jgi:hypothetical protein
VWRPTQATESRSDPPLLVTTFRSDPSEYPRLVAGVAWINTSRTTISLYAGRLEPSVELPSRGPMEVPPAARGRLLATFNSGFKLLDAGGGWALGGHTYAPMRDGQATLVRYADGRYDVISWHGGASVPADVVFARQNLPLIVSGGRPSPLLNDSAEWGATLGNAVQVWRSGIGVDRHGNLLYAAANYQTVGSLADILIHAGAVRAMELDINTEWVSFMTYDSIGTPSTRPPPSFSPNSVKTGDATSTPTNATSPRLQPLALHEFVGEERQAVTDLSCVDQVQRLLVAGLVEDTQAGSQHDRENYQPQFIGQVLFYQCAYELIAAVDQDFPVHFPLQLRNLLYRIAVEDRGVAPLRMFESRRHDVLGEAIHSVRPLAAYADILRWPPGREPLKAPLAQQ